VLESIWPLTVGKRIHYHRFRPHGTDSWQDDVTVIGTETLTIGDKSINTFVVRWNSSGDLNRWEGTMTVWYAPSLGWVARIRYSDNVGDRSDADLVSYELAPASSQ